MAFPASRAPLFGDAGDFEAGVYTQGEGGTHVYLGYNTLDGGPPFGLEFNPGVFRDAGPTFEARDTGDFFDFGMSSIAFYDTASGRVGIAVVDDDNSLTDPDIGHIVQNEAVLGADFQPASVPASSGWQLLETQGFDMGNDGDADLLWWHTPTGFVGAWDLRPTFNIDGTVADVFYDIVGIANPSTGTSVPADVWSYEGVGDFDGDTLAVQGIKGDDILWATLEGGGIGWWNMADDGTYTAESFEALVGGAILTMDAGWEVAGVAEINQDSDSDVVFRDPTDTNGAGTDTLFAWQNFGIDPADGNVQVVEFPLGFISEDTEIWNVSDYNGDGDDDLLLAVDVGPLGPDLHYYDPSTQGFGPAFDIEAVATYLGNVDGQDWYTDGLFGNLVG